MPTRFVDLFQKWCVSGIAREVAALTGSALQLPSMHGAIPVLKAMPPPATAPVSQAPRHRHCRGGWRRWKPHVFWVLSTKRNATRSPCPYARNSLNTCRSVRFSTRCLRRAPACSSPLTKYWFAAVKALRHARYATRLRWVAWDRTR